MELLDKKSTKYIITMLGNLLLTGEKFKAIQMLRNLKDKQNVDISYLIDELLPLGDILFYRFVKSINRDLINSFHAFDKYLHTLDTKVILDLFKFDIIEPHYSAQINNVSLDKVLYMIIQFSEYNDDVIHYLFEKYSSVVKYMGLLEHMIFYNVCHDIFIYVNACNQDEKIIYKVLHFSNILESYQAMYNKHEKDEKYNKCLRSRLIGLNKLIAKLCKDKHLTIPSYNQYQKKFSSYYQINTNTETTTNYTKIQTLLNQICLDSYNYINDAVPWGCQRWIDINYDD
jgi:hypothetical protein